MGWCSGTYIFDDVCAEILKRVHDPKLQHDLVLVLVRALEDQDWDCESESKFWDNPVVRKAMKRLNPEWDWKEIEEL